MLTVISWVKVCLASESVGRQPHTVSLEEISFFNGTPYINRLSEVDGVETPESVVSEFPVYQDQFLICTVSKISTR